MGLNGAMDTLAAQVRGLEWVCVGGGGSACVSRRGQALA